MTAQARQAAIEAMTAQARKAAAMAAMGTRNDPGPGRLVRNWVTGDGPRTYDLPPDSRMTREFVQAPSVRRDLAKVAAHWAERDGGEPKGTLTEGRHVFGGGDIRGDGWNGASQVTGSARLDGHRQRDHIDWSATNDMGLHSLFYGRPIDEHNSRLPKQRVLPEGEYLGDLPTMPNMPWAPGRPLGTRGQILHFQTDLWGRPIMPKGGKSY